MGVGCKRVKYQFSPPTSRSLPLDKESSNHFLVLPKGVKEVLSTNQPTNQPYSAFLIKFFTFLLLLVTSATSNLLNILSHCEMIQPRSDAMKAVKHLDPKI